LKRYSTAVLDAAITARQLLPVSRVPGRLRAILAGARYEDFLKARRIDFHLYALFFHSASR
jgi:hypothetical protein